MMKLSIVIPYYNAEPYTSELLDVLAPQICEDVEVILVDDGSRPLFKTEYKWCRVIHQKNKGGAAAKNKGLDHAKGEYIQWIDADDMVPEYFVKRLLEKIDETQADIIEYSWKSFDANGTQHDHRLSDDNDRLDNPSVCTRAFKRSYIGDTRLNENKDATYDEDFSRRMGYLFPESAITVAVIPEYMYFYRTSVDDSSIKKYKRGLKNTKRITYYYEHIRSDMTWLLEEVKREDEKNEVILLTKQCDIPELKRYCQIQTPSRTWTHIMRGDDYPDIEIISVPVRKQVIIYTEYFNKVSGIGTFIYNWCQQMKDSYEILFLYDRVDEFQLKRLRTVVAVMKNSPSQSFICDTLIINRITDRIPKNVAYTQTIQICHACIQSLARIPKDRDHLVNVSQASKDSWGEDAKNGIVIHNMAYKDTQEALLLVSATRIGAADKGKNDSRYIKLAQMMQAAKIPFIWLNFSDVPLNGVPGHFINMGPCNNVQDYIARADYLIQLSDVEACSMSVLEALTNHTALICTPVPSFFEQGVKDGENAHVVPFDMDFDVSVLKSIPKFKYSQDVAKIKRQWKKLLGKTKPFKKYTYIEPQEEEVEVIQYYKDLLLGKELPVGSRHKMAYERARELEEKGFVKVLRGM